MTQNILNQPLKEGGIYTFVQHLSPTPDGDQIQLVGGPGSNVKAERFAARTVVPQNIMPTGPVAAVIVEVRAVVLFAPALVEQGRQGDEVAPEAAKVDAAALASGE